MGVHDRHTNMRRAGTVLFVGITAAAIAVALVVVTGASSLVIPIGALGAAIPVVMIYGVLVAGGADDGDASRGKRD